MHKRICPGLKLPGLSGILPDDFVCVYILYFVLPVFINTLFESLEFASYFRKKSE